MLKLNFVIPVLLLLSCLGPLNKNNDLTCDFVGEWSQVSTLIDSLGHIQTLAFTEQESFPDSAQAYAEQIHSIYYSGRGNIEIDPVPTLTISKKRVTYKKSKFGKYHTSDDCKTIVLQNPKKAMTLGSFSELKVIHRYRNIIVVKQGMETVFYLKRDPRNPYFVGEQN